MSRVSIASIVILSTSLLIGCAALPLAGGRGEQAAPPTLDPARLTVTPVPTSTPQATFTPFPTALQMPTSTPYPTFAPLLSATPEPAATAGTAPSTGSRAAASGPAAAASPTFSGYIGIPEAGDDLAELQPILVVDTRNAACDKDSVFMQIGLINWGNKAAYNFTVEWSAGTAIESGTEFLSILQWGDLPVYFRNKRLRFPCTETTTYTAYVYVDVYDDVPEIYEDNNRIEITFTVPYIPPEED